MKLGLQQSARPDLHLRLSPQMLQRIEVLQLSALDLVQLIEQELQENETLEQEAEEPEAAVDAEDSATETSDDEPADEWEDRHAGEGPSRMDVMAATAAAPVSLQDHLGRQLDVLDLPPRDRTLAAALVGALGDRGWLDAPLADVIELPRAATA